MKLNNNVLITQQKCAQFKTLMVSKIFELFLSIRPAFKL